MNGACGTNEEEQKCSESFDGKKWKDKPLGRHRFRWIVLKNIMEGLGLN
jgi:hypothetical protein